MKIRILCSSVFVLTVFSTIVTPTKTSLTTSLTPSNSVPPAIVPPLEVIEKIVPPPNNPQILQNMQLKLSYHSFRALAGNGLC